MKNKKIIIIVIIVCALILMFIPKKLVLNDGGSIEYKSKFYSITKIHRINNQSSTGYEDGWKIEILGIQIYNEVDVYVDVTDKKEQHQFVATVIEKSDNYFVVEPEEGSNERKSSDKISFTINKSINNDFLVVGSKIKIIYDGVILETYPAQITVNEIELLK